jgi:hypothetical protein
MIPLTRNITVDKMTIPTNATASLFFANNRNITHYLLFDERFMPFS